MLIDLYHELYQPSKVLQTFQTFLFYFRINFFINLTEVFVYFIDGLPLSYFLYIILAGIISAISVFTQMVQLRGQLVNQWKNLYPDKPFPHPKDNPQMFPSNFVIKKTVYNYDYTWWDELWGDCCAFSKCCPKGLIDYECQFNNNCYVNLINLAIHVIGFLLGLIVIIILFGYASRLAYKFVISVGFLTNVIGCLGGCMKCFTFGVFDQKVYYKHQKPKAEYTKEQKKIIQMGDELEIKIIIPRLDDQKKQRLLQIFEDYQVVDDSTYCLKPALEHEKNKAKPTKQKVRRKTHRNAKQPARR